MSSAERNPRSNKSELLAILDRQLGLITIDQWLTLGHGAPAMVRACDRGEFVRVLPRVYRSTLVPASLREAGLGAVLWAGDGALGSHFTAARIYGAEVPYNKPHIWVPKDRRLRSARVVVHRGDVPKNDRRIVDRVPVTSPSRTLVDLAGMLDEEMLEAVAEDFFHRGVTTPFALGKSLDRAGSTGRPGSHLLRALLEDRDQAPAEKMLEVKIWRLLRGAKLKPVRQFGVTLNGVRYRLDFAFPTLKVGVEGMGFAAHGGRLKHVRDYSRLADLVAAGWAIVPVTWEAVTEDPAGVVARVRSALVDAAA